MFFVLRLLLVWTRQARKLVFALFLCRCCVDLCRLLCSAEGLKFIADAADDSEDSEDEVEEEGEEEEVEAEGEDSLAFVLRLVCPSPCCILANVLVPAFTSFAVIHV